MAVLGGVLKSFPSRRILRLDDFQYSANKANHRTAVLTTGGTATLYLIPALQREAPLRAKGNIHTTTADVYTAGNANAQ